MNLHEDVTLTMAEYIDDDNPMETVRKYFPETWIWDIVSVK